MYPPGQEEGVIDDSFSASRGNCALPDTLAPVTCTDVMWERRGQGLRIWLYDGGHVQVKVWKALKSEPKKSGSGLGDDYVSVETNIKGVTMNFDGPTKKVYNHFGKLLPFSLDMMKRVTKAFKLSGPWKFTRQNRFHTANCTAVLSILMNGDVKSDPYWVKKAMNSNEEAFKKKYE
ncbi:hypothetical protein FOL47_001131, partial [Perkinsus chesapeaki]